MRALISTSLIVALIAVTGCSQPVKTESFEDPQEVLDAFTKLSSSTEVGITYNRYIDSLTEVNTALTKYKETGKANPYELMLLQKAFDGYLIAGKLWGCEFKNNVNFEEYKCRDEQIVSAATLLPDVKNDSGVKSAIASKSGSDDFFSTRLDKKAVMTLIWLSAEKQVILAKVKE